MANKNIPSPEIQRLLKEVVDHFREEDRATRERQLLTWRRLKLFWEGFHRTWYSEVAHDWRIWDEASGEADTNQAYYDRPINIFRAYLESIIAALSVTVPPVKCFPDDADNTLDLLTAKSGDKISGLIYRHNDVPLLWLHALFIYCTEGLIGCYHYSKSDKEYGTYKKKIYDSFDEEQTDLVCPNCKTILEPDYVETPENANEMLADEICPTCEIFVTPIVDKKLVSIEKLVKEVDEAKSRVCLEAYGGLNIKVALYARKQEETPYLIYMHETHYANAIEKYGHLKGKDALTPEKIKESRSPNDPYEAWARMSPQLLGDFAANVVTEEQTWLRPCAFNVLDEEDTKKLKKLYPEGCQVAFVNGEFGEAKQDKLDDNWTLNYNPMSDYLHYDPLGLLLVSAQEISNDLISLITQTIEHGIPQTFADPGVLNFNAYSKSSTVVGGVYEAIPKSGKSVGDAFYEVKTATLSGEVLPFVNQIQSLAQLVSGALPSLFGGSLQGSETASEYSMSRAQALQRQQNVWKMLQIWWKRIFAKAIPKYMQGMVEDERDVQLIDGNFVGVLIRKAELEGKIGRVELEANENLPMTWNQRKDVVMQLLTSGNPELMQMLMMPENLTLLHEAIGLDEFYVMGEDDKNKAFDTIRSLLESEPIVMPPDEMNPEGLELPSTEPEEIDNFGVAFEICRKWAISEIGRETKITNPAGYKNVLIYAKMCQLMINPMVTQEGGAANPEKPNELDGKDAPITGESDVETN